jgi:tungstate transport system substrate-binding protein
MRLATRLVLIAATVMGTSAVWAQSIVLASTTSTEQSGLFAYLLPKFKAATGIDVKVVALGTGQALDMGRRGDADVLLVHDRVAEDKIVSEGFAVERRDVMYNDFVLIGPQADPQKTRGADIVAAHQRVAAAGASYVSRGDKSGTHAAELRFWSILGMSPPAFAGYRACGCGMGPALNMASATDAYVLGDRSTWLNFKNRGNLEILVQGDKRLFNPYGVMLVNPERHPSVKVAEGRKFIEWITSPEGKRHIPGYQIDGQQVFFAYGNP